MTIGELFEKVFYPLDRLFADTGESKDNNTKNEMTLSWLKANDVQDSIILADSWYTNSTLIEGSHYWLKSTPLRILVKEVVTRIENGSSAVLLSSDTTLSSEEIIHYYALRWTIESFFEFAKQHLSFSNCQIRSSDAQNHFMLLISVAYLIFWSFRETPLQFP